MAVGAPVSSVLWLCDLVNASDPGVVRQMWQRARQRMSTLKLTGALLFDGERICELLEGHIYDISAVYRDLEFDLQFSGLRIAHASLSLAPRRLADWRLGPCGEDDLDIFDGEAGLTGEPATQAFLKLLQRCQLMPG